MKLIYLLPIILISFSITGCFQNKPSAEAQKKVRQLIDTVGFAQYSWQMDSLISRMDKAGWEKEGGPPWRLAICPHDDYTYVGSVYLQLLSNIKAPNLILIGVAHKAAQLGIEDSLIFESNTYWEGPWENVKVSPVREELLTLMKKECAVISDTLHQVEHSVESLIPFLQYFNRDIKIIPILVPTMSPERMEVCGKELANAIRAVADRHRWKWGRDYAIIVTTDAVHYGNEDWGGVDRAYFGCDTEGNRKAINLEYEIIEQCLIGKVTTGKIRSFSAYTLESGNYKEYKWTWCGRYCVPVALYASYFLNNSQPLLGELVDYSSSITRMHIPVDDLGMGRTAIATKCHWVGYASIGYR